MIDTILLAAVVAVIAIVALVVQAMRYARLSDEYNRQTEWTTIVAETNQRFAERHTEMAAEIERLRDAAPERDPKTGRFVKMSHDVEIVMPDTGEVVTLKAEGPVHLGDWAKQLRPAGTPPAWSK